jgi:hypothetical protein
MCEFIQDTHVMPGYVCHRCKTYNGLQRERCRACDATHCILDIPANVKQCPACKAGYPDNLPPDCLCCGVHLGGDAQIDSLANLLRPVKLL